MMSESLIARADSAMYNRRNQRRSGEIITIARAQIVVEFVDDRLAGGDFETRNFIVGNV